MKTHPKIEHLQNQRDMLAGAVRGLESTIEQARDDLQQAQVVVDDHAAAGIRDTDPRAARAIAERDRRADRLNALRQRRKSIDDDRSRVAQVAERLAKWWRDNGGNDAGEVSA